MMIDLWKNFEEVLHIILNIARDGTTITQSGNTINCSDGTIYILSGRMLSGPTGPIAWNCSGSAEALGIVLGLHGGRRF